MVKHLAEAVVIFWEAARGIGLERIFRLGRLLRTSIIKQHLVSAQWRNGANIYLRFIFWMHPCLNAMLVSLEKG